MYMVLFFLFNKFQVYPLKRTVLYNRTKSRINLLVYRNINYGKDLYMAACDIHNKLRISVIKMTKVCYDTLCTVLVSSNDKHMLEV